MSDSFSHSRLSLLDDCPRRYRFRYVEKRPEAFTTAEAFMGTMVHEALQWLYLQRESGPAPSEAEVVERYRETWRQRVDPSVRVVQESGRLEDFLEDGEGMIRRHVRGTYAEDRLETLAIEPKISVEVASPEPRQYVGYIDRLARDREGTLHVIDYKTSKRIPASAAQAGLQLRGYGLGVFERHGGVEVGLRWEYLRHDRALVETMPRSLGHEVATELGRRIGRAVEAERQGDFPARPSNLCRWCGYRGACDASPYFDAGTMSGDQIAPQADRSSPAVRGLGRVAPGESRGAGTMTGDQMAPQPDRSPPAVARSRGLRDCPLCGSALRFRASSRGEIVACSRYPDCAHVREATPEDRAGASRPSAEDAP